MNTSGLLERHAKAWRGATRHPFLDGVREGTVPAAAFAAWLVQDYAFVRSLLRFQAQLLARAPRAVQAVLAAGAVGLEAELSWFEEQARQRGLALEQPCHPVTEAYDSFLVGLGQQPYAAAITALWALERAYLEAWRSALPGHPRYREFVAHWTMPAFEAYVDQLAAAAEAALASGQDQDAAEAAFLEVTRLERAFWDMAWVVPSGGARGAGIAVPLTPARSQGEREPGPGAARAAARTRDTVSLARALWQENAELARAAREHPFVRGLGDGTLPRAAFQQYIAQDAFFLEAFARAYALALARSPDQEGLRTFFQLLAGVIDELQLHGTYAARWGLSLDGVAPRAATLAYTDFLLATAALGTVGETCAAMTPCMRLYAYLGQSLAAEPVGEGHPYAEWIQTYAAPEFEALAGRLEALLGRYAQDTPAVRAAYRRAMELEVAFFEASLTEA